MCRNAEAGYTTAVASRAGLVARHTGPQREGAALPLPAESPAERTEVCVSFFAFLFVCENIRRIEESVERKASRKERKVFFKEENNDI